VRRIRTGEFPDRRTLESDSLNADRVVVPTPLSSGPMSRRRDCRRPVNSVPEIVPRNDI